ncbi:MAG TPA: efflux RND transporter periplasmic adaptor subunit [Bryobacteraceae bacterium]|nr:efflux RND transporter periplasmic adaptor subunit [Bryobacteraceae bacterium]
MKSIRLHPSRLLGVLLAALLLAGCASSLPDAAGDGGKGKGKGKGKNAGNAGPVPVEVANVALKSVPVDITVVGNVEAYSVVTVRAQTGGMLNEVRFAEGDYVKKGDLLFLIDPKPLEGQMNSARANLAKSAALLKQAQAQLARDTASANYTRDQAERYQKGVAEGVFAKEQGEQLKSAAAAQMQVLEADRASISSAEAQISADQSAINNLNIQLGYTTVKATQDGRTGNILQKAGNIVTANTTDLATIYQVEPIYVSFAVPEARLADIKRYSEASKLAVTARAQDGSGSIETGELTFIDNTVDTSTGTIKLKGTFPNKQHKLWPGQFVNVGLRLTTRNNAVVVPNQAVQTGQDGTYVYVVGEDRAVSVRAVKTGPRIDQDMVIDEGLKGGETVVTEGQLRLQPGSKVQVRGQQTGEGRPRSSP